MHYRPPNTAQPSLVELRQNSTNIVHNLGMSKPYTSVDFEQISKGAHMERAHSERRSSL